MTLRPLGLAVSSLLLLAACGGGGGGGDGGGGGGGNPPPPPPPANVQISLNVTAIELPTEGVQTFTCAVTGSTNTNCSWRVEGSNAGTISGGGFYTAPSTVGTYRVIATAAADSNRTASATVTVRARQTAQRPWVTGYYAGWYWNDGHVGMPPEEVDMSTMTHFVFGRVAPGAGSLGGAAGTVVPGGGNSHDRDASPFPGTTVEDWLIDQAHDAGIKALLMLGGDGGDGAGFHASSSDALRPGFVDAIVDYMVEHDYDGVDVDWENNLESDESRRRLLALLDELRIEANSRPRYQTTPVLITFPGYAVSTNFLQPGGRVHQWQADVANKVDQYNLMSYGIGTASTAQGWVSWFSGPIFDQSGNRPYDLDSSIRAYVATGVPRSRIGVGMGFYGIYFGLPVTGPRQPIPGGTAFEFNDNALAYSELRRMGYLSHGTYSWDEAAQVGYRSYPAGYVADGRRPAGFLSYENEQSIAAKGRWVRETGVGGAIIWMINYGYQHDTETNPLMQAVKQSFLE